MLSLFLSPYYLIFVSSDSDAVNKIMEDLAEQKEVADEISDALVAPVDFGASFDEDELEQELKELTGELDDISLDDLPAVPQQNVKRKEKSIYTF